GARREGDRLAEELARDRALLGVSLAEQGIGALLEARMELDVLHDDVAIEIGDELFGAVARHQEVEAVGAIEHADDGEDAAVLGQTEAAHRAAGRKGVDVAGELAVEPGAGLVTTDLDEGLVQIGESDHSMGSTRP